MTTAVHTTSSADTHTETHASVLADTARELTRLTAEFETLGCGAPPFQASPRRMPIRAPRTPPTERPA